MSDELDDLLSGPDDAFPEGTGAEPEAGNGQAVTREQTAHAEADRAEAAHDAPAESAEPHAVAHAETEEGGPSEGDLSRSAEDSSAATDDVDDEPPKPVKPRPPRPPVEEISQEKGPIQKDWYILKVQSNREDSIADALQRRIAIAGLGEYFDEIIVPTEKVSEFKGGKKRIVKRKIYPGYIVVHMELNDDTWFLVRETPGIGDFTGSGGKPTPMLAHEVNKIVAKQDETAPEQIKNVIPFNQGDRVRIKEGTFENFEGDVDNIDQANGRVTIMINIFGRSTPVELEYYQAEKL
ncbi:MAG TPA: transcription termination/antitermination protein NusG [Pirellulales bacterium]|nr:transcription termination/antitermination protein NusG [Pirellulales bacterium]